VFLLTRDLLDFSALLAACFVEADEPPPETAAVPERFAAPPTPERSVGPEKTEDDAAPATPFAQPPNGADEEAPGRPDPGGDAFASSGGGADVGGTRIRLPDGQAFLPEGQAGGSTVGVMAPPQADFGRVSRAARRARQPALVRVASPSVWEEASPQDGNGYDLLVPQVDSPPPGMQHPVVRLRGPGAAPRYRYTRTTTTLPRLFPVPRLAFLAALAVLVLGLVAWFGVPRSVQENREERFAALIAEARSGLQVGPGAVDAAQRRDLLSGALASLNEAASIYPDDGQAQALRIQVQAALTDLDAVVDLGEMRLVADLDLQLAGDLSLHQVVVGDGVAFFLDEAGGRVVELPLEEGSTARVVLQEGEFAGALKASRPLYVLWWQADGESGRLLVLDDQRHLFSVTPAGAAPLVLRDAQEWGSLDGAATFDGNLYILDAASNQVWRYPPTDAGFDSERSALLGKTDLSGATGLAVDGGVHVLVEEGGIRRFAGGVEEPFALAGIDRGLLSAASLTGDGRGGLLVADRGNKRLVSLSPDGQFQAQFVSRTFTDLRSTVVDAEAGLLYVLVGDSLYVTEMPLP
jgi:hypothetical protein